MDWQNYIERNPAVLDGKPVVKGTRISVELILERFSNGWTEAQLLEAFPHLKAADIRAAHAYALAALADEEIVILADASS